MRQELSLWRDRVRSVLAGKLGRVSGCEPCGRSFGYAFRMKLRKTTLRMTGYGKDLARNGGYLGYAQDDRVLGTFRG
jgi:hypothetical protein